MLRLELRRERKSFREEWGRRSRRRRQRRRRSTQARPRSSRAGSRPRPLVRASVATVAQPAFAICSPPGRRRRRRRRPDDDGFPLFFFFFPSSCPSRISQIKGRPILFPSMDACTTTTTFYLPNTHCLSISLLFHRIPTLSLALLFFQAPPSVSVLARHRDTAKSLNWAAPTLASYPRSNVGFSINLTCQSP